MRVGVNLLFLIPSEVGGTETHSIELLKAICDHFPHVQLVLFTNRENHRTLLGIFDKYPQVEFSPLNFNARFRPMRILREQLELPFKVSVYDLDLLFSLGYTAPYFSSRPQVLFIHDMQYKTFPGSFGWFARKAMHALILMGAKRSTAVMTPSEFSKREVLKYTEAAPERIHVALHGTSDEFSRTSETKQKTERLYRIPGLKMPYILCVGFSHPQKNLPCLVYAFKEMLGEIPHQLVLVGGRSQGEKALARALKGLPVDRYLRLAGIPRGQLVSLYHGADLFVLPTLYEGFGLPVLEAMKAEIPVITTRCGSIPEVAGEDVVYFDEKSPDYLKKKIREVLAWTPERRREHIQKARIRADRMTWKLAAEGTIQCFENVIGKSRQTPAQGSS